MALQAPLIFFRTMERSIILITFLYLARHATLLSGRALRDDTEFVTTVGDQSYYKNPLKNLRTIHCDYLTKLSENGQNLLIIDFLISFKFLSNRRK